MLTYLAATIFNEREGIRFYHQTYEVESARNAAGAAYRVFSKLRASFDSEPEEYLGFADLEDLLEHVSQDDTSEPLYLVAVAVRSGTRNKLKLTVVNGRPIEQIVKQEVMAEEYARKQDLEIRAFCYTPFRL